MPENPSSWTNARVRHILRELFDTAIAAADPRKIIGAYLPEPPPSGRCIVIGAGKAAALMAAGFEAAAAAAWPNVSLTGCAVTRYGHAVATKHIEVLEASHPVPDANSLIAAQRILETVHGLAAGDLVIALISGGGSALMASPGPGLSLADKQEVNSALLLSGATITEMNCVRKHLSMIKGGRLALAAAPARLVTLAISDVPGDDPAAIASGPTVADPTTLAEAREVIARHGIRVSPQVHAYLARAESETCKPGTLPPADYRLIATPLMALQKCASRAQELGLNPLILGDALEGESREMGIFMAGIARSVKSHGLPVKPPAVLLSGGETTVTIGASGAGLGGRNCEFLLSLAIELRGEADIFAIAGDTDGIDGTEDAAGAIVTPNSLLRALANGVESRLCLKKHDSYSLFDRVGDLIRTGPTLTNVNDFRAILVIPKG